MVDNIGLKSLLEKSKKLSNIIPSSFWKTRQKYIWKTKDGKRIVLKDVSDVHLSNIIPYLENHPNEFSNPRWRLAIMNLEKSYRELHNITVPDYNI